MSFKDTDRIAREMASQKINATNPGSMALENATAGGIRDIGAAANAINAEGPNAVNAGAASATATTKGNDRRR